MAAKHKDKIVIVASRRILKLYNVGAERVMSLSEEEKMKNTLKVVLQTRFGNKNGITITKVIIDSQTYILGEEDPQLELVLTVNAHYTPPPHLNFGHLLMTELSENLATYRNRLIAIDDDYFRTLRRLSVSGYYNRNKKEKEKENIELQKDTLKQKVELHEKKISNPYHYSVDTSLTEEQKEHQSVRDVSITMAYSGTENVNYSDAYVTDDSFISQTALVLILTLVSLAVFVAFIVVYTSHLRKKRRIDGDMNKRTRFPNFNVKEFLRPSSHAKYMSVNDNKRVRFSGVTDFDLKDAKDISFRGVMDYENGHENKSRQQSYQPKLKSNVVFV